MNCLQQALHQPVYEMIVSWGPMLVLRFVNLYSAFIQNAIRYTQSQPQTHKTQAQSQTNSHTQSHNHNHKHTITNTEPQPQPQTHNHKHTTTNNQKHTATNTQPTGDPGNTPGANSLTPWTHKPNPKPQGP